MKHRFVKKSANTILCQRIFLYISQKSSTLPIGIETRYLQLVLVINIGNQHW
jgi:hypothetical protein